VCLYAECQVIFQSINTALSILAIIAGNTPHRDVTAMGQVRDMGEEKGRGRDERWGERWGKEGGGRGDRTLAVGDSLEG